MRDALRTLALANNGGAADPDGRALLERRCDGRLVVRIDGRAAVLAPVRRDVRGALADLVGIVYTAMADGTWSRLKACRRDVCMWLFYDRSRNRSAGGVRWRCAATARRRTRTARTAASRDVAKRRRARTGRP